MENIIDETFLRSVHERYMRQRERIHLPQKQIGDRKQETRFRASRLYGCSTADYYARTGIPHTHPHSYSLLQRFEQGNRVAEIWQEAFVWASKEDPSLKVEYEFPMENEMLVGQADLVINNIPVEIKNTIRQQFYGGHILQLMAYCYLLKSDYGYLIYQSDFKNMILKVYANNEIVSNAISIMGNHENPPEHVWEMKPGLCCTETEPEQIFPREAKRANSRTGAKKGDIVPGRGTVKCPWFGKCFPWAGKEYGFMTISTQDEYNQGIIGSVASTEVNNGQRSE